MEIKPIRTRADYRATLKEVEALMSAERDTPEGERLDVLVTLIEAYERRHYPLDLPDPVEAIRFRMEQKGLTPKGAVHRPDQSRVRSPEPPAPADTRHDSAAAQRTRHSRGIPDQAIRET
jgi:hypothetical protein